MRWYRDSIHLSFIFKKKKKKYRATSRVDSWYPRKEEEGKKKRGKGPKYDHAASVSYCIYVIIRQLERFEVLEQGLSLSPSPFSLLPASLSLSLDLSVFRYFRRTFHPVTCRMVSGSEVGQTGIQENPNLKATQKE